MGPETHLDAVADHAVARWGEPSRRARFDASGFAVGVLKWDAERTAQGVALYLTVGASAAPMAGRDPGHRLELVCGLLPPRDDVARSLARAASYPARGTALAPGRTIDLGEPLWQSTTMTGFLVARSRRDLLPALELPGGRHVEFLQAIPVFGDEIATAVREGAEELLRRWEAAGVRFWDPDRPRESR